MTSIIFTITILLHQLLLPIGLEEYVSLESGQLIFEESAKSLAQFKVVENSMCTKENKAILKVKTVNIFLKNLQKLLHVILNIDA